MHFSFYLIDTDYCNFLRETDPCVPYNMIPVPLECLTKISPQVHATDSAQDIAYKNLLSNQLSWCNSHRDTILKQADKLYRIVTQGKAWDSLYKRCCNFSADEQRCLLYRPIPAGS